METSVAASLTVSLFPVQARAALEREYNSLLAIATDRRMEEVTRDALRQTRYAHSPRITTDPPRLAPYRTTIRTSAALPRGGRSSDPKT